MALNFHPNPGTILICDYSGFQKPEMVKRRPVVVISPRLRNRNDLCTVVPLSTTPPDPVCEFHLRIVLDRPLPKPWDAVAMWVKADMLATVGFYRLDLIRIGRDHTGKRKYLKKQLSHDVTLQIRQCVSYALGMI